MAAKTKTMSTVKQILRLFHQGKKIKFIARNCCVSKNTIKRYLQLQSTSGHSIEELLNLEDVALEAIFSSNIKAPESDRYRHLMDLMPYFLSELKRPHVTRTVLWQEYLTNNPDGYGFTQFAFHLANYQKNKTVSMVMEYAPGDVMFVDYAGKTLSYFEKSTGEEIKCQVFIATLGYSQKTYIQVFPSQKVIDFIDALNKCVIYFGGIPKAIVPDNLKSAVIKSDRYEPALNRVLEDWANHNNTTVLPARAVKPKDKSLVEGAVKTSYSRVYAPLRDSVFTSIYDLNQAVNVENEKHNGTKFQKKDYSRQQLFDSEEKLALLPLPQKVFTIKKYRTVTVQKNCYVYMGEDSHYYSVPMRFIGQKVELVYTINTVSIYHNHVLVAQHLRFFKKHGYSTISDHLPSYFNDYKDRSPGYYQNKAAAFNPELLTLMNLILAKKIHPELAYKSCDGLLSIARKTDNEVFTNACKLALLTEKYNYKYICEVISNGAAKNYTEQPNEPVKPIPKHENIRGKEFFNQSININYESRTANV